MCCCHIRNRFSALSSLHPPWFCFQTAAVDWNGLGSSVPSRQLQQGLVGTRIPAQCGQLWVHIPRGWASPPCKALGPHGGHGHFTLCHVQSALGSTAPCGMRTGPGTLWRGDGSNAGHGTAAPAGPTPTAAACCPGEAELLSCPAQVPGGQGIIFIEFAAGLRLWRISFISRDLPWLLLIIT